MVFNLLERLFYYYPNYKSSVWLSPIPNITNIIQFKSYIKNLFSLAISNHSFSFYSLQKSGDLGMGQKSTLNNKSPHNNYFSVSLTVKEKKQNGSTFRPTLYSAV